MRRSKQAKAVAGSLGPDLDLAFVRSFAARMGLVGVLEGILEEGRP